MDFDLTPEQGTLRDRAEAFCREHCSGEAASALDRAAEYPDGLHRALADAGLLAWCAPREHGGEGGGPVELCLASEVLGRHSAPAATLYFVNAVAASLIALGGTDVQQARWVRGMAEGRTRLAFALTEAGAGSDAGAITTRAERCGDEYVVEGTKLYVTGADVADVILTVVRTGTGGCASQGTSLLAVPGDVDGLRITPLEKIAGNAIATCLVEYDRVRVPVEACIGDEGGAWSLLLIGSALERLAVAAISVGMAQAILDEVTTHVTSRQQFGQPLSRFQAIQHQLAEVATEVDAMRLLTYRAAWLTARGRVRPKEVSMAKGYATERLPEIAIRGMRLLGGRAYFTDCAMPRRLREALMTLYAGGTVEIQRNVVAKSMGL